MPINKFVEIQPCYKPFQSKILHFTDAHQIVYLNTNYINAKVSFIEN